MAFLFNSITIIIKQNNLAAFFIAASGVILFSTKAVIIKLAYQYDVDAITLLLFRMLFSLPFYLIIWALRRKEWHRNPLSTKQKFAIGFLGVIGYYLASFFDFKGLTLITASLERLILFSYPTVVLILSFIFLKKKITKAQVVSIFITYLGIAIIFLNKGGITAGSSVDVLWGSIFVGISAITYAIYLVGSNSLIAKVGTVRLTTFSMIVSCTVVVLHYLLTTDSMLFGYQPEVYWLSFLMAVVATVIPSFLINEGIQRIGASNVSIIGSLGPVSTITLSMIFLGEMLTLIQFGGALIIISGVAIISLTKRYPSSNAKL
tara:strand:+ start:53317 stop:54273 length:957 start_codon:yes stop_codon:yes gene_type:complete